MVLMLKPLQQLMALMLMQLRHSMASMLKSGRLLMGLQVIFFAAATAAAILLLLRKQRQSYCCYRCVGVIAVFAPVADSVAVDLVADGEVNPRLMKGSRWRRMACTCERVEILTNIITACVSYM